MKEDCELVTFPLVSWVRCGTWLYRFLIFAPLLTWTHKHIMITDYASMLFSFSFLYCQLTPVCKRGKLRQYSPTQLTNAYKAYIEDKVPVYWAAGLYSVPLTTLRDRVDSRISIGTTSSGPSPLFDQMEEAKFVEHIKNGVCRVWIHKVRNSQHGNWLCCPSR